jgi:hypothetical protein
MIGRGFCKLDREVDITEAVRKLDNLKNKKYYSDIKKIKGYTIKKIEKGTTKNYFPENSNDEKRNLVPIIFNIEVEKEENLAKINSSQTDIDMDKKLVKSEINLFFWLFSDRIIFSNVPNSRIFLIPRLKEILGFDLKLPEYDVDKVFNDFKADKSKGDIRGYGFKERKDYMHSGFLSGDPDTSDQVVAQTINDKKTQVLLKVNVLGDDVFFTVYSSGSVVIGKNW